MTLLLAIAYLLSGCDEPKTYKMDRMHALNPSAHFYVQGDVKDVGNGITQFRAGEMTLGADYR